MDSRAPTTSLDRTVDPALAALGTGGAAFPSPPLWLVVGAMLFPTLLTWVYFRMLAGQAVAPVVYGVGKVVQFALPLLWLAATFLRRPELPRPRVARPSWAALWPGVACGLLVGVAAVLLYTLALRDGAWLENAPAFIAKKLVDMHLIPRDLAATPGLASPVPFMFLALFLAVPHALLEEYYYRWFIHGGLARRAPMALAVLLSSAAFMGHHVIVLDTFFTGQALATAFFSLCVMIGGAIWAVMYQRSGSLYGPWLSHVLIDLVIMTIGYDLVWQRG